MSRRIMRMIVFFDLPMITSGDLVDYGRFRKFLLNNGFIMMQKSVYSKLVLNNNSSKLLRNQIEKNLPQKGTIQIMQITEKQFGDIDYLIGESQSKIVDSIDRVVEI